MKKRLEEIDPGTPVFCEDTPVGEVRAVYCIGDSKLPEFLNVYWNPRSAEVLVPTNDVSDITEDGVYLQGTLSSFDDLATFENEAKHPTLRRLH